MDQENSNMKEGSNWYYCIRRSHWWSDRPGVDHGMPTGFNRGNKDCGKGLKWKELK